MISLTNTSTALSWKVTVLSFYLALLAGLNMATRIKDPLFNDDMAIVTLIQFLHVPKCGINLLVSVFKSTSTVTIPKRRVLVSECVR